MNMLRLLWTFLRVGVMGEAAYRVNFIVQLMQSLLSLGTALGALAVVFAYTDTLAGWRPDEVIALVGVYILVGGVIGVVIQPSMERLIESVHMGTLDFTLTKPEDAQVLVSVQAVDIWEGLDILLGAGVLGVALVRLGGRVGVAPATEFGALLVAGGAIVYAFWLMLATLSLWFVRVENILVIFQSLYEAGRWPVSIYPGWLRFGLTFIVPVTFAVTVPAEALTGRLTLSSALVASGLAAVLLIVARLFWKVGLRNYTGASAQGDPRPGLAQGLPRPRAESTRPGCWNMALKLPLANRRGAAELIDFPPLVARYGV
jgi:ABC-2 type transport system permease protein